MRGALTIGFVGRATLVVIALCAVTAMAWLGREILFIAFFAILVALFLSFFVDPLVRWGVPRTVAVIGVVLILIALVVLLTALAWPTLNKQIIVVRAEFPGAVEDVTDWIQKEYNKVLGEVGQPSTAATDVRRWVEQGLSNALAGALPFLNTAIGAVVGILLLFFAGIYLTVDPQLYIRGLVRLVPPGGRNRFARSLDATGHDLRRWILGTVVNMIIIGILSTLGLLLLGVPAALALGLIAAALEFIPIFGPVLSAIPAVAVALLTSPKLALWTIVLYIVIQEFEAHVLSPLVMRGAVRIPPVLTLLIGTFMFILFGFLGLLLAVPLLAAALVLMRCLYVKPLEMHAPPVGLEE